MDASGIRAMWIFCTVRFKAVCEIKWALAAQENRMNSEVNIMQEYGKADYMWHIIERFIDRKLSMLTAAQKEQIKAKCRTEVFQKYPSVQELEVTG